MPSKRSTSNSDKGCVGFAYGGIMKDVRIRAFSTEDSDPTKVATDFQTHYGEVNMWYVPVKDVESTFEKYLEQLNESKQRFGETHLFKLTLAEAKKALIDVTEAKKCTSFSLKKKEAKSKDKDDGSDDGSDDDNEEKSDNEETVKEEKPQKKDKKAKSKKEESEEDSEKSDKKSKKKTDKKSDKKKQESDDDKSDEDESDKSDDDDDDEGKKLETKKSKSKESKAKEEPKKSKSKSK
jgi:hypothetical protein